MHRKRTYIGARNRHWRFSCRPTDWWTGLFTSPPEFFIDWGDRAIGFHHPCNGSLLKYPNSNLQQTKNSRVEGSLQHLLTPQNKIKMTFSQYVQRGKHYNRLPGVGCYWSSDLLAQPRQGMAMGQTVAIRHPFRFSININPIPSGPHLDH